MIRARNPNKVTSSPVTAADKTDIQAALLTLADRDPTLEELRNALAVGKRGRMTDGLIHQTLIELGIPVATD